MPDGKNTFRDAFASAKKNGQKTFTYNGKRYTTETAAEKAKKQDWVQNIDSANKAARQGGYPNWKSKSHKEIAESYGNQASKQLKQLSKKKK